RMRDFERLFLDAPESLHETGCAIEGALPEGLEGTLYRNGPGIQRAGSDALHLLDGYGLVGAATLGPGGARFAARHVETPIWKRERSAGRQLARRAFTNRPGRWSNLFNLSIGNGAAHDVYRWGEKLLATDNPGHFELDALTLDTTGRTPLEHLKATGLDNLAPMPRADPVAGTLVTYAIRPGPLGDTLTFVELKPDWTEARRVSRPLGAKGVVLHDLAFTPSCYVAVELGRLSVGRALWGEASLFQSLGFGPDGALRVWVLPRDGSGSARPIRLPKGQQGFHLFNAFDREDGALVVDLVLYDAWVDFDVLHPPGPRRRGMDAAARVLPRPVRCVAAPGAQEFEVQRFEAIGEAPAIHPGRAGQRSRYGWFAAPGERGDEDVPGAYFLFHGVGRLDFETGAQQVWSAGPRAFCPAPSFAPRPGGTDEEDGWLLPYVSDAA
ncbi:MAG: carotenoid oxygenase family protein, partial [Myxococcales bacterium]